MTSGVPGRVRTIAHRPADDAELPVEGRLPGFEAATGWLNSAPLAAAGLRGRVVLVQFWTYTCINWLRTLPYVRAWAARYGPAGLTVIGVHTPEFGFERNVDNIVPRAREFGVEYPIAVDSDYGVWSAFANHFWPALYLADAEGRIRYHHFGEGEYAMSEMAIQELLREAGATNVHPDLSTVDPRGFEVEADWRTLRSPETYLAARRTSGFASPDDRWAGVPHAYPEPPRLGLNEWAPIGTWTIAEHAAVGNEAGGRIAFRYQARDVNLVMGPASRGASVRYRVRVDGLAPGAAHGFDIDADGAGVLVDPRLHQLVRETGRVGEHLLEIEFLDVGAEAYCFTFG